MTDVVGIIGQGMVELNDVMSFNVPFVALFEDFITDDTLPLGGRWLALPVGSYPTLDNMTVMDVRTFKTGNVNFGSRSRTVFQYLNTRTSIYRRKAHESYIGELTAQVNDLRGTPIDMVIESIHIKKS